MSLSGNNLLTLTTTTDEGPIAEARLTFRMPDFHPIAAILLLHDTRQVEVTELVWDVLPLEAVDPAIFSTEPMSLLMLRARRIWFRRLRHLLMPNWQSPNCRLA